MHLIDLLFLLIILFSAWSGWRNGFIYEAVGLITWAGSLTAAFYFYPYLARPLSKDFPALGIWTLLVAFLIVLIVFRLLIWILLPTY